VTNDIGEVISRSLWLLGQPLFVGFPLGMAVVIAVTIIFAVLAAWKLPRTLEGRKRLPYLLEHRALEPNQICLR